MFERSLSALIKGLRSHRGKDEPKYVAQVMDEIRHEVRSGDMEVKAEAVLKLTYLQMLGYPLSGASFHMLEVMASPKYHHKHVGYLAAAQCFSPDTDVLILATNMVKKDLHSSAPLDVAIALNGLAHIVTPDLARHLGPDVITLLTHSRGVIRKKALLVLYAMIIKCPEMLDASWDRLREKLDDPELGVVSAAVNIICELARRDPRPFLPLSPQLFKLLTTSTNNWMLIKIIKLFASLTPLEPRLVKKLVPPITTIISTTPAMSLLYECIHTIIIGGMLTQPGGDALAQTCVDKLATFLADTDQNLKYIALLALVKILPTHPHLVAHHQDVIFESIEDHDLSIRLRALELVAGMAVSRNLESIVRQLMSHLDTPLPTASAAAAALKASLGNGAPDADAVATFANPALSPTYRLEIVNRILTLGANDTYANILDFNWYIDTLLQLTFMTTNLPDDAEVGATISAQLIDITARVRAVRPHAVQVMTDFLRDPRILPAASTRAMGSGDEMRQARKILHAAAWIVGEYCDVVPTPSAVIPLLLQRSIVESCDVHTAVSCLHNAVKLFAHWASAVSETWAETQLVPQAEFGDLHAAAQSIATSLNTVFSQTNDSELQERAAEYKQLFALILFELEQVTRDTPDTDKDGQAEATKPPKSLNLLSPLFFSHALGPVAAQAQDRVLVPPGLDLNAWIVPPDTFVVLDSINLDVHEEDEAEPPKPAPVESQKTKQQVKEAKERRLDDPFYISDKPSRSKPAAHASKDVDDDVDSIPIVQLDLSPLPPVQAPVLESEEMPEVAPVRKAKKKAPKSQPDEHDTVSPTPTAVKTKKKSARKKAIVLD